MNTIRLYVAEPLLEGAVISASAAQAHYLGGVMRRSVGDLLRLFNGTDGEWEARIVTQARGAARFEVRHRLRVQSAEPDLWLLFAPLKRDATDLVVQKATELGASVLQPVSTERTNAGRVNVERMTSIAIEAAEQCERLTVPTIHPMLSLELTLLHWPDERPLFVAMERDQLPPAPACSGPAALLIGPEGGLGPVDRRLLRQCPAIRPISLGSRILRAETAAIAALALLQRPVCG